MLAILTVFLLLLPTFIVIRVPIHVPRVEQQLLHAGVTVWWTMVCESRGGIKVLYVHHIILQSIPPCNLAETLIILRGKTCLGLVWKWSEASYVAYKVKLHNAHVRENEQVYLL